MTKLPHTTTFTLYFSFQPLRHHYGVNIPVFSLKTEKSCGVGMYASEVVVTVRYGRTGFYQKKTIDFFVLIGEFMDLMPLSTFLFNLSSCLLFLSSFSPLLLSTVLPSTHLLNLSFAVDWCEQNGFDVIQLLPVNDSNKGDNRYVTIIVW